MSMSYPTIIKRLPIYFIKTIFFSQKHIKKYISFIQCKLINITLETKETSLKYKNHTNRI